MPDHRKSVDDYSITKLVLLFFFHTATASGTENMLQPPPLAYKKWSLGEQEKVSDYVACGTVSPE